MKENFLVDLSKQFAVDIVNLCTDIKENRKSNILLNQVLRSGTSIGANIHEANYAASKAAVIGMTKSLARELASRKITVNAIAPGVIETAMTDAIPEAAKAKLLEGIPFREMGQPEDVANLVAFLAGDESKYITGQVICVDGGMAM